MSDLTFDGSAHTVTLRDRNGRVVGTWPANNRTDSHSTLQFVPNGPHQAIDTRVPNRHSGTQDSPTGEYGSFGIVRFDVPGHAGVGIHAGRQGVPDRTPQRGQGVDHVTMGCIRTTEDAMGSITRTIQNDPLTGVTVTNNRNQRR